MTLSLETNSTAMAKVKEREVDAEKRKVVLKRAKGQWVIFHLTENELIDRANLVIRMEQLKRTMALSELKTDYWSHLLGLSNTRLQERVKQKAAALSAAESERVRLFEQVYARGVEAFGNEEKFKRWLEIPSPALEHKEPRKLMNSMLGLQRVMSELEDIAYGTYA